MHRPFVTLASQVALVLLAAVPAAGQYICASPCAALILPEVRKANMLFENWMVPIGTPRSSIKVLEPPRYGAFNLATQDFVPTSEFWKIGLDRMVVQVPNEGRKVLLLIAATPYVEQWTEETEGNIAGGAFGDGITLLPPDPGPPGQGQVGLGSGARIRTGPPGFGASGDAVVHSHPGVYEVQMRTEGNATYLRAKVVYPSVACGGRVVCETPYQKIDADTWTRFNVNLTLPVAPTGPCSRGLSLRFDLTSADGEKTKFELDDLVIVGEESWTGAAGRAGLPSAAASAVLEDREAWRLYESSEDRAMVYLAEGFEAAGDGYEATWTEEGAVQLVDLAGNRWLEAELAGTSSGRWSRSGLTADLAESRGRLRLTFDLDPSGLQLQDGDNLVIFAADGDSLAGTPRVVELFLRRIAGTYWVRARAASDSGAMVTTALLPLDSALPALAAGSRNTLSLQWRAGDSRDGELRLEVNHRYSEARGIANGRRAFRNLHFGPSLVNAAAAAAGAPPRVLRIDDIAVVY